MRSRAASWLWHIAMIVMLALGGAILPSELALVVTAMTGIGWLAGSSIPHSEDPHGN